MSRTVILALGALLWAVVAVQQSVRIATGDWTGTAIVVAGGVAWLILRRAHWRPVRAD